jgi:type II secretory pathway component PulF
MKKIIYYLPRALAILIVAFLSIFILEGFGPEYGWQDSLMHLLVALIALGAAIAAWKWPKIGGWIFVLLGLKYLLIIFTPQGLWNGAIIGGIPLITGILFLIEGFRKK